MEVKASQFLVLAFEVQTSENMRFTVFFTFALFFNLFFFTKNSDEESNDTFMECLGFNTSHEEAVNN